jgi:CRISPR-associated protein Csy1
MLDSAIDHFLSEKKESWLNNKVKGSKDNSQITALQLECENRFSLKEWLPNAAKRAGQMSISTHPCTFSHPSAQKHKNKKEKTTPVYVEFVKQNDGFLKTGSVDVDRDALGNAAVLDVYKFLTLVMQDNQTLLSHIQQDSDLAMNLLNVDQSDYQELKSGFLALIEVSSDIITSSKIKQVFFPLENEEHNYYHQLSLVTNSGIVFQLKKRLDALRFSDEIKVLRDKKRNNIFSEQGYSEIYDLTTIGYGGANKQNISVLNNENVGKAHLLSSMPPPIEQRHTHFPKRNFFVELLQKRDYINHFYSLHALFKTNENTLAIRQERAHLLQELMDQLIAKMWAVRAVSQEQYHQESSQLFNYQKIWLHHDFCEQRENSEDWLDQLIVEIVHWIHSRYEKWIGKQAFKWGEQERLMLLKIIESNREALR